MCWLWSGPKTPFLRSIGKSNVEPNKTPARIAIEKPNIAFMRFARSEASAPRSPCFSVGFCTFCPSSMSGKSPHEAAVEASEFTFFISTSRAGSKSSNADARERKSTRQMPAPGQQSWPMAASHPVLWEDQKARSSLWPIPWAYCSDPKRWGQGRGRWSGWCMGTSNFPASTWPHQLQLKARRRGFRHLVLRWGTSLWPSPREGSLLTSPQRKRFHHQCHNSSPAGSSLRNRCQQSSNRNIRKGDLSPWALWLSKAPGYVHWWDPKSLGQKNWRYTCLVSTHVWHPCAVEV